MKELIEQLRKKAMCIFIAVHESVARDVAEGFHAAIAALEAAEADRQRLEARIAELEEALKLADAALEGANMNMNVVKRKVKAALAKEGA